MRSLSHDSQPSCGAAISLPVKLVVLDLIQDGPPADTTQNVQHPAGHDERPRSPLETRGLLEQFG